MSPPVSPADVPTATHGFLFADLRDYTRYVESHGDHAAAELLGRYRTMVRSVVAPTHGAEILTEGDSFYVVFDSASAAVRGGLAIIAAAAASDSETAGPIQVGVGVHAGETVVTAEGFVGSAVNIAARLCAQAKAGELVVSETVRALTRTYLDVDFEPLGTRHLKGVEEPVVLYRVVPRHEGGSHVVRRRPTPKWHWVAAGSLVIALVVGGALGLAFWAASGPEPTPAPTEHAGADPSPAPIGSVSEVSAADVDVMTTAERTLLSRIPRDFQPYCRRSSRPDGSLGGAASFRCDLLGSPGYGADTVWYDSFDAPGPMATAVGTVVEREGLLVGDCSPDATGVIGRWSMGISFTGQRACYAKAHESHGDAAWMLWTYEGLGIAARAVRDDGDRAALFTWWDEVASPWLRY